MNTGILHPHRSARATSVAAGFVGRVLARIRAFREESVWALPVLRGLVAVGALFVFAWLGSTRGARPALASAPNVGAPAASVSRLEKVGEHADAPASGEETLAFREAPSASPPESAPTPEASAPHASSAASAGATATADDPVYLNNATIKELRRLPGIGEKRAQAILSLRDKMGRFRQVEDLLRVKGIGRAMVKRLRPLVRLEPKGPPPP